jgi:hypothetical protein
LFYLLRDEIRRGDDAVSDRPGAFTGPSPVDREIGNGFFDDVFGIMDIVTHVFEDQFYRDRLLLFMPDIVVRDETHCGITHFGLTA